MNIKPNAKELYDVALGRSWLAHASGIDTVKLYLDTAKSIIADKKADVDRTEVQKCIAWAERRLGLLATPTNGGRGRSVPSMTER